MFSYSKNLYGRKTLVFGVVVMFFVILILSSWVPVYAVEKNSPTDQQEQQLKQKKEDAPRATTRKSVTTYQPLTKIPGVKDSGNLQELLNGLIKITIGIAAVLAVIMLAIGGVRYMLSEAAGTKEGAKKQMWGAVGGLVLALISFLLLSTINPNIVNRLPQIQSTLPQAQTKSTCYSANYENKDAENQKKPRIIPRQTYNAPNGNALCAASCSASGLGLNAKTQALGAYTYFCSSQANVGEDVKKITVPPIRNNFCKIEGSFLDSLNPYTKDRAFRNEIECSNSCNASSICPFGFCGLGDFNFSCVNQGENSGSTGGGGGF